MSAHGTRRRYVAGCRCDACQQVNAQYQRDRRARERTRQAPASPGPVERGVLADVERLSEPSQGLVAATVALARILDNPGAITSQLAAARQLDASLERMRRADRVPVGRLAAVKSMTARR